MSRSVWSVLGVPANSDRAAVRRAYAAKLRQTHPEDDPEGFMALRAAYDQALAMADARERYGAQDAADDEDEPYWDDDPDYDDSAREAVFTTTLTPDQLTPTADPAADPPSPDADLLEGRDRDLAEFETRMNALAGQLTSPWAQDEKQLEAAFRAILTAPAMHEIGIRAHAEEWIAGLLASNIPKSDALLLQAIEAFGWDGAHGQRGQSPAVGAILHRIDEWRTIEVLTSQGDQFHFAFNELTRPPRGGWEMRLRAMNPGVAKRIRTLIDFSQWQMPGLRHSFNAETVAWWGDHLARPRMTFDRLVLAPALFTVVLALGAILKPAAPWNIVMIAVGGLASLALPWAHLATIGKLTHARESGFGPALPRWAETAWIAPIFALPVAAMFIPPSPAWAIGALLIAALGMQWTQLAAGGTRGATGENAVSWVLTIGVYGFFGFVPFLDLPATTMLVLCAAAALVIHARVVAIDTLLEIGEPLTQRFKIPGLAAIVLLGGVAIFSPLRPPFIAGAAFAVAALLINAMFHGQIGWLRYVTRVAIALAFLSASIASMPEREGRLPLEGQTIDEGMAALKREHPGFALVEANNPELNGQLRTIIDLQIGGAISDREAQRRMMDAIDASYERMLPMASDAVLVQTMTLELQRRLYYKRTDSAACAGRKDPDSLAPTSELGRQIFANMLLVVGTPATVRTAEPSGQPIATASIIDQAARLAATDRETLLRQLESVRNAERCAARIALLRAILTRPEADIAATVRATHRRRQIDPRKDSV